MGRKEQGEEQITTGEDYRQRITSRFEYLDGLTQHSEKTYFIVGVVPSIFTHNFSEILGNIEGSRKDYRLACGLFVHYLRDIYAELTGHSNIVQKAKDLGLIDTEEESRLLGEAMGIDDTIPPTDTFEGADIFTDNGTCFFDILGGIKEEDRIQYQKRIAALGIELNRLSTQALLGNKDSSIR